MARIRTIKPEFFRHEALQDLEIAHPGMHVMLVFAGLWGHCDSKGRFEWRPRQLKLDILPFLPFDMTKTLALLESAGLVVRYESGGKEYGEVPNFEKHQRITGKEATDGEKYPANTGETSGKHLGNIVEKPVAQEEEKEGKGKGREREREEEAVFPQPARASIPTLPGLICRAIRAQGIPDGNPSDPIFLALIEAGASADEFKSAAAYAKSKNKASWKYVIGIVKGQREEAAKLQLHRGPLPQSPRNTAAAEREAVSIALTGRGPVPQPERDITAEVQRVA